MAPSRHSITPIFHRLFGNNAQKASSVDSTQVEQQNAIRISTSSCSPATGEHGAQSPTTTRSQLPLTIHQPSEKNDIFRIAVQKHIDSLPENEREHFQRSYKDIDMKDTITAVRSMDTDHARQSAGRRRAEKVDKVVKILNPSLTALSLGFSVDPSISQISSLVLGGLKMILKAAERWATFFTRLTDMLCHLGSYAEIWEGYATTSCSTEEAVKPLKVCLAEIYGDMLSFCREATRIFFCFEHGKAIPRRAVSFRVFHQQFWGDYEEVFQTIDLSLNQHIKNLQLAVGFIQLSNESEINKKLDDLKLEFTDKTFRETKKAFMQWLSVPRNQPLDFEEDHRILCEKRHKKTGEWIFKTPEFKSWMDYSTSALLWCYGNAGAGKSVLASSIIEYLREKYGLDDDVGISFAYCKYDKRQTQYLDNILPNLIKQLCYRKKRFPQNAEQIFQACDSVARQGTPDDYEKIFRYIVQDHTTVFVILDALDECPLSEYKNPLAGRKNIIEFIRQSIATPGSETCIKFIVTSRYEDDIQRAFMKQSKVFRIETRHVERDIKQYVEDTILVYCNGDQRNKLQPRLNFSLKPELRREIFDILISKSQGMFLWVYLHLEMIFRQKSPRGIRKILDTAPSDLDETYDNCLKTIETQEEDIRDLAYSCIQWVLQAEKSLHVQELMHLTVFPDGDDWEAPVHTKDDLLDVCSHLIVEEASRVRLVHYSVKEFLLSARRQSSERQLIKKLQANDRTREYVTNGSLHAMAHCQIF
ncbi:uncharacterized protein K452DRAFT_172055 [Aplosporella prunicola CBS 121167]|uniref:Uncharacterized protein n=1 Tax=Aplosporella prunicola CBS 121167 TaxID=1176127 RepID=A0A6A6BJK8_9PEZI|nr:uncharacterized protein K452DRAFT_172055 [Aplosporella prunicola CBS 121167]KAF2143515.1 hypothetical protein K452DRAFT_172055 [Aplosporella prunicola CBS 121167]